MTKLKLAIFDCDGTLVDSQHSIVRAMTAGFHAASLPAPSREDILSIVGLPLRQCVEVLLPQGSDAQIDAIAHAYSTSYREHRESGKDEPPLYPHTREILETLHEKGVLLAIATGKSRRGLQHTMKVHQLEALFVDTKTADDGPGKPNPDILLDLCTDFQVAPHEAVMIGDTTFDIEMAAHAKMPSIGVRWGYHSTEKLRGAGAYAILERWEELPDAIDQRFKRS